MAGRGVLAIAAPNHTRYDGSTQDQHEGTMETFDDLVTRLKDGDERVRCMAVIALGKRDNAQAVEPLLSALKRCRCGCASCGGAGVGAGGGAN
jgi:hypothetical protein